MAQIMFGEQELQEVNVNKQGSIQAQQSAQNILEEARNKESVLKTIQDIGNTAVTISNANNVRTKREEATFVKGEYLHTVNTPEYLAGSTMHRAETLMNFNREMEDKSSESGIAALSYSSATLGSLHGKLNKEQDENDVLGASSAFVLYPESPNIVDGKPVDDAWGTPMTNKEAGKDNIRNFVDDYSEMFPRLDKKDIRDSVFLGITSDNDSVITQAQTRDELNEILVNVKEIEEPVNEVWGVKTSPIVNRQKASRATAISQANKNITLRSQGIIANANSAHLSNTIIGPPPEVLTEDIKEAYSTPLSQQSATVKIAKNYTDQQIRVGFLSNNTVVDVKTEVPKQAKEVWQQQVTKTVIDSFNFGEYSTTVAAINNNPDFASGAGFAMYQTYNQAKTQEELNGIVTKMSLMNREDRGGTALRTSLGEDKYTEILAVQAISNSIYPGDIARSREYYNQSKDNQIRFSRDLKDTMDDHQVKLGRQYAPYNRTMTALNNIDPRVAKEQESTVREFYLSQTKEYGGTFEDKIEVDESMATNPFEQFSLDPEKDTKLVLNYLGGGNRTVIALPNGRIQVLDEFGGTGAVINAKGLAEFSNINIESAKILGGNQIPVADVVTSKIADVVDVTINDLIPNTFDAFGNLFIPDTYMKSQEKLRNLKDIYDTTNESISGDTRSEAEKNEAEYAQQRNIRVTKQIEDILKSKGE